MPYYENHPLHMETLRIKADEIKNKIYEKIVDFDVFGCVTKEPMTQEQFGRCELRRYNIGDKWGEAFDCGIFKLTARIPEKYRKEDLSVKLDFSGEGLLYENGIPVKGFTSVKSHMTYTLGKFGKTVYPVPKGVADVQYYFDAGNNDLFGHFRGGIILEAGIYLRREKIRKLYYDYAVLCELMFTLSQEQSAHYVYKRALTICENALKTYSDEEIDFCEATLAPALASRGIQDGFHISALGHSHLDLAWTWPIRETKRKAARTFSTQLAHMDTYPEYVYGSSQAQLYEWIEKLYPPIFERIKSRAAEGRWELQGGMWVEPDLNVTGGESLVRQFLFGQKYFIDNFGKKAEVCWIPDSFGFTGCLPQLIKSAGMKYFVTQKIRTAPHRIDYPHDLFFWEGIDGTKILTHAAPFENYGSSGSPKEVYECEKRFRDKLTATSCLLLVGQSDGGGGSGAEVVECILREKNIAGLSPVSFGTALEFFKEAEQRADEYETWYGSMDLDMHTGTLTSACENKKYNKLCECALHTAEWLNAIGAKCIEKSEIDEIWKKILLYQFHDILPGTSINRVYDECLPDYRAVYQRLSELIDAAAQTVAPECSEEKIAVINASPMESQRVFADGGQYYKINVPPYFCGEVEAKKYECALYAGDGELSNGLLDVKIADGAVVSVKDEKGDEYVRGGFNRLTMYDDVLNYNEDWGIENAWDMPIRFRDGKKYYPRVVSEKYYVEGASAVCETVYKTQSSTITQKIRLDAGTRKIDFQTQADWNENCKMLRAAFGINVYTKTVKRGLQFGNAIKNTHRNTTWDSACFETVGYRYVDMSDGAKGAAITAATKYGYGVIDNTIDICLLRSSSNPAENLDKGVHAFVYSVVCHRGALEDGNVLGYAYSAEYPLIIKKGKAKPISRGKAEVLSGRVIIDTVKPAEDGNGVVIRVYEPYGVPCRARLKCERAVSAAETDIIEQSEIQRFAVSDGVFEADFGAFAVKTIKLTY